MDSQLKTLANTLASDLLARGQPSTETAAAVNQLTQPDFLAMSSYLVGTEGHLLPDTFPCLVEYLHNTYLTCDVSSMMLAARLGLAAHLRTLCFENDPELAGLNCVLEEAVKAGHLEPTKIMLVAIHDKFKDLQELILSKDVLEKIVQGQRKRLAELASRHDLQPEMAQALAHFSEPV